MILLILKNKGSYNKDRLDDLENERVARLEIMSQSWKDLQRQVEKTKQTIKKVLDKDTSFTRRFCSLFP